MSEHKREYMSEDDYSTLIWAINQALDAIRVPGDTPYRQAVRVANGVRGQFELTRKPDPLPDRAGAVIEIPRGDGRANLYVLACDGIWHLSSLRYSTEEIEGRATQHGVEVVV